jgi:hypothetical protein
MSQEDNRIVDEEEIHQHAFGVRFTARGENDPHLLVTVLLEDDEHWHEKMTFSSFWLNDLISVLEAARARLERAADKNPQGWGYQLRAVCEVVE